MRRMIVDISSPLRWYYHSKMENWKIPETLENQIYRAMDRWQIDQTILAFDGRGASAYRAQIFPGYKAERTFDAEIAELVKTFYKQVYKVFPCEVIPGYEADDVIGSLVQHILTEESQSEILIYSRDSDFHGLLSSRVRQLLLMKYGEPPQVMTSAGVFEKYGIQPVQWLDYRILVGDSSDEVPGVAGIGPKTAREILEFAGDLETAVQIIDDLPISPRMRQVLREYHESGDLDVLRRVFTLRTDAPHKWRIGEKQEASGDPDS